MTTAAMKQPLRPVLARCLPFAAYMLFLAFGSWLASYQSEIALRFGLQPDLRCLYPVQIAAVLGALALFRRDYLELWLPAPVRAADWALSLLLGIGVFALWINLDSGWVTVGETKTGFVPLSPDGHLEWPLIIVRIFGAAAVVPVMEELFWRSFIQRWIDRLDFLSLAPTEVSLRALLFASVVFGFEHSQWLAGIVAGLAYGYLYRRSGSLWPPIMAHGVTNFLLGVWVVSTGQWYFW